MEENTSNKLSNKLEEKLDEEEEEDSITESLDMMYFDDLMNNSDDEINEKKETLTNEEQELKEIKRYIKRINKKDFTNEYIFNIEGCIKRLNNYRFILLNIKEETDDDNIKNKAIELKNTIPSLIIKIFEIYMIRLKKEEFENMNTWEIDNHLKQSYIKTLYKFKTNFEEIEKETNDSDIKNKINELKKDFSNILIKLFEIYISKLGKENFEYKMFREITININYLKEYTSYFIEIEKETNDDNIRNKAIELKKTIPKMLIKLFEIFIPKLQKEIYNNNHISHLGPFDFDDCIKCLIDYEAILSKKKEETKDNYIKNKIDELINKFKKIIPNLLVKLIEVFLPEFEKEIFNHSWTFSQTKYQIKILKEYKSILIKITEKTNNNYKFDELIYAILSILVKIYERLINKIEKEFKEEKWLIEIKSFKNINQDIKFLENYEKILVKIKEEAKVNYIRNKIDELIYKSKDIIPNLLVKLFELFLPKLEKGYFEEKKIHRIFQYIKNLKNYKTTLIKIKRETKDNEIQNKINELIYKSKDIIPNLLIKLIEIYIPKLEKDFKKINVQEINEIVNYLNNLKKEITNNNIKKKIDIIIIKLEIKKIEQKDFEKIETIEIQTYIEILKDYISTLIKIQKEANNNNVIIVKINELINKVSKLELNFYEKYITELEKIYSKNIDTINIQNRIDNLNKYKLNLINISNVSTDKTIKNKLNEITKRIDNIINKINNQKEQYKEHFKNLNNQYEKIEEAIKTLQNIITYIFNIKDIKNPTQDELNYLKKNKYKGDFEINNFNCYFDKLVETLNSIKDFKNEYLENKEKIEKLKEEFANVKIFYNETLNYIENNNILIKINENENESIMKQIPINENNNELKEKLNKIENEINNKINKIENKNFNEKNESDIKIKHDIEDYIDSINEYKLNLINLENKTNNSYIKNLINKLKSKVFNIQIKLFEIYIDKLENFDFENIPLEMIKDEKYCTNYYGRELIKFKKEINNEFIELINNLIKRFYKVIEKLNNNIKETRNIKQFLKNCKKKINALKNKNFKIMGIYNIENSIKIIGKSKIKLIYFFKKTKDIEIKQEIEDLIVKEISITQINLIEKYINKLEKENNEIFIEKINKWKEYEEFLLYLKKELLIEEEADEKINILINKISNIVTKIKKNINKTFGIKQRSKSDKK